MRIRVRILKLMYSKLRISRAHTYDLLDCKEYLNEQPKESLIKLRIVNLYFKFILLRILKKF